MESVGFARCLLQLSARNNPQTDGRAGQGLTCFDGAKRRMDNEMSRARQCCTQAYQLRLPCKCRMRECLDVDMHVLH